MLEDAAAPLVPTALYLCAFDPYSPLTYCLFSKIFLIPPLCFLVAALTISFCEDRVRYVKLLFSRLIQ